MFVKVLWLLVKPQCDWFLYTCIHIKAMIFMCLFHRLEHMTVIGGQLWPVGWMWKNFSPKLLQLFNSGSRRVGWVHAITSVVSYPLSWDSITRGFHHSRWHWQWCSWVTSLSAEAHDDQRKHWEWCKPFSVLEMTIFPLLIHAFILWITVQTPGLIPSDNTIQKLVSLFSILQQMFQADTHRGCLLFLI